MEEMYLCIFVLRRLRKKGSLEMCYERNTDVIICGAMKKAHYNK